MLPKQLLKKMVYFIEKMQRLNRPTRSLIVKRKFIAKARDSRLRARGLYGEVKKTNRFG